MTNARVKPIAGELMRFHIIGDSVRCTNCFTDGQPTLFPKIPWDEDEKLNRCSFCHGRLERNQYLVDLSEYFGNGACSCQAFEFRCAPHLKILTLMNEESAKEELARIGYHRCKHIHIARRSFLDEVISKLSAAELVEVGSRDPF